MTMSITKDELKSFFADNFGTCTTCRGMLLRIRGDERELLAAVKIANRHPNAVSAKTRITGVKQKIADLQERARNHVEYDH